LYGDVDDFSNLSALIVDAQAGMRSGLRGLLSELGVREIEEAVAANAGLQKLAQRRYDLVFCEYHLGDGQDGQHFLEDARHHGLLPLSTIFIMVTGESEHACVVGAAELAPSDYLLKPFAADLLYERIERALAKRAAFLPAYRAMDAHDLRAAIACCDAAEARFPQYILDFLRLKAELHLAIGEADAAQAIYRQVIDAKAVPWARLGLGKALFMQKRYAEADQALAALVLEERQFVDAYDWLARTREALGDFKAAQQAIQDAVAISPHAVRRLRRLGEVALEAGDAEAAERALSEVVRKGKYSEYRDPEDHMLLVRTQVARDDRQGAEKTIRDMEKSMHGHGKTGACAALSSALVYEHAGETDNAKSALARALAAAPPEAGLSPRAKLQMASSCLAHAMDAEAGELLQDVMRNAADGAVMEKAKSVLRNAGKAELADQMEARIGGEVLELVSRGASRAHAGDHEGAVALMLDAAKRMPGNVQVAFNASLALLKHIEHRGWDRGMAARAKEFLDRARKADPVGERISALAAYYQDMLGKYGIAPGQVV
jgi:DNA-binding NarL/FixJ family response regulator/Tfp pilus assembly protein PilF